MSHLTIGMATYDDFDGVYFTVQALNLYQDVSKCEIIVVDNYGCKETENFIKGWVHNARYILDSSIQGTAYPRNQIFKYATSKYVLCIDSHVLLFPGVIENLLSYYKLNPGCPDLLHGPMYYDDLTTNSTQMNPVWRSEMLGVWAYDPKVKEGVPFDIPMHGLGVFSCKKDQWLGFNPLFRGFGGEEGYIHEKYRQHGRRCLCLPWLGWVHRFGRPKGVTYRLVLEDKIKNYIFGHLELGKDLKEIYHHFKKYAPNGVDTIRELESECREEIKLLEGQKEHAKV
jgi:glycosyltransferase involved in cell wall biosynthesis